MNTFRIAKEQAQNPSGINVRNIEVADVLIKEKKDFTDYHGIIECVFDEIVNEINRIKL